MHDEVDFISNYSTLKHETSMISLSLSLSLSLSIFFFFYNGTVYDLKKSFMWNYNGNFFF